MGRLAAAEDPVLSRDYVAFDTLESYEVNVSRHQESYNLHVMPDFSRSLHAIEPAPHHAWEEEFSSTWEMASRESHHVMIMVFWFASDKKPSPEEALLEAASQ